MAVARPQSLLSCLLFFIIGAIWLQSLHAVLWTALWLAPAWILYVHLCEEPEPGIHFGESHLRHKAQTPFL